MLSIEDKVLTGTGVLLLGSVLFLGGTLAVGAVTGLLSAVALGVIILRVREFYPKLWLFICRHPILSDVAISGALFFLVSSNTAVGVIAGGAAGVFSSIGLNLCIRHLSK